MVDINSLSIALVSYLTGAVAVYAYTNRNRYLDLALASVAIFTFATAMLLRAFSVLTGVAGFLANLSTLLLAIAVLLFMLRITRGLYESIRNYLTRR
ncbi:MAG: hypothetical protein ACYC56_02500 [Candidatus Aquicultor sp.]